VNRHQKAPLVERSPAADRSCQLDTPTAKPAARLLTAALVASSS
jgi:hypothetical protein